MDKKEAYLRDLSCYRKQMLDRAFLALRDDVGRRDITTLALLTAKSREEEAVIIAKEEGIFCGVFEARAILEAGGLEVHFNRNEGDHVKRGEVVAEVRGEVREILSRERTALDYLQVLSGIATTCYGYSRRFPGRVASLRKTHPGLAFSEKRAVHVGGALTHRLGLFDGFLIKDNHLASIARELFGLSKITEEQKIKAIEEALRRAKAYRKRHRLSKYFIEVEVESLAQALAAARFHHEEGVPDMILLDNMRPQDVAEGAKAIREVAGHGVLVEASGGINPENLDSYMATGVDAASMSFLTLNARPLDFSLKLIGYK